MMIAALLVHSGFRPTAETALRYFGLARTANGKGVTIPSQMRFVHYYEQVRTCQRLFAARDRRVPRAGSDIPCPSDLWRPFQPPSATSHCAMQTVQRMPRYFANVLHPPASPTPTHLAVPHLTHPSARRCCATARRSCPPSA